MEWVETTGRTVDDAKAKALDQLGVGEDDAEFDVLDEPRAGLFGRVRGEARVRARVRPTQPRPKLDRRDRRKRGDAAGSPPGTFSDESVDDDGLSGGRSVADPSESDEPVHRERAPRRASRPDATSDQGPSRSAASRARTSRPRTASPGIAGPNTEGQEHTVDAQQVGEEAAKFMQGLVDAFGVTGTVTVHRDEDDLEVAVEGADLGLLVGPRGSTLQAIQELTRVAAQRRLGDHDTRLRVDVGGYRERRREALSRFAIEVAATVVSEGTARTLEPMSSADRKVIHDVLSDVAGVVTRSEGDDPNRRVVIAPGDA